MTIVGREDEAEEFLFRVGESFDHVASIVGVEEELETWIENKRVWALLREWVAIEQEEQ